MATLVAGQNTIIEGDICSIQLDSPKEFGKVLGAVWLPVNNNKQVVTSPAYLHESKEWAVLNNVESTKPVWQINLTQIFKQYQADKLQLIVYAYFDPNVCTPAVEVNDIDIGIDSKFTYHNQTSERHIKACKVLELYQRNEQYKCRALAEYSTVSLQAFSEGLDISLDARYPQNEANTQIGHISPQYPQRPRPRSGETWTGTAFAIDSYHLLTCEHVVDGASVIALRQQGKDDIEAKVLMSDAGSDSALLKVETPLDSYLPLLESGYEMLGEDIITLGFPLTGISSQLQVTQGCIAGLQGIHNDIRFIQFTAPIQPGSSGSPLILPTGEVIGMVTASIVHEQAQNMNFAVKYQLLSALITSAGLNFSDTTVTKPTTPTTLSTPQLTKQSKSSVWLVGCQA